jgi:hypothetical protein
MKAAVFGALCAPLNVAGRFDPQESCAQRMTRA